LLTVATRDLVLRIVEELGYTPHFGGRALVSNRTHTVGAVIPTMENAIFARGLQAFQETLANAGTTLLVASSGYDLQREFEQIRSLVGRGVDGLMLIGADRSPAAYDFLARRETPFVLSWNYRAGGAHCFVGFDNRRAAFAMASKVIACGHRRIGVIAGITAGNDRARDRVDGIRAALQEAGIAHDDVLVLEAVYTLDAGRRACVQLLQQTPRPTAIVCGNDVLAVGVIAQAKALGLHVPRDLSVTGFDDLELAAVVTPTLTTVQVPHRAMGEASAVALLALGDGAGAVTSVELETTLVMRESLVPPA
jgi:LacI family transcriptional regulator